MNYRIICLFKLDKYQKKPRIIVYHSVCKTNTDTNVGEWNLPVESFHAQMNFLSNYKYNVINVDEVLLYLKSGEPFPNNSICITFDDGYENNYLHAFPILAQYGLKATFYVVTEYIGSNTTFSWLTKSNTLKKTPTDSSLPSRSMSWEEINRMAKNGMAFSSHSHTHPNFSKLYNNNIRSELIQSRNILESHLGSGCSTFACPFHIDGPNIEKLKKVLQQEGFTGAFLNKFGSVDPQSDCFDLPRISIYGDDSLEVFKCKINGGFDWLAWYYSIWQNFWTAIKSMKSHLVEEND